MIERGAQVRAIDLDDRASVTNARRDLAVAGFDFFAQDMPFVVGAPKRAGFEVWHVHTGAARPRRRK